MVFEWIGSGSPAPLSVTWSGGGEQRKDTLHFDGSGRAATWLRAGEYRYRLDGGGGGTVAIEEYSDELLPAPVTLTAHEPRAAALAGRSSAREWLWLFGLCVVALSGEWLARRRLGLR
jgi:hypothetical protein